MKTKIIALAMLALAACTEPKKEQATEEMVETHNETITPEDTGNGSPEEREAFAERVNKRLDMNRLDIEELKGKLNDVKKDARREYEENLVSLQKRNDALRARLDAYRGETAEEWREFKTEFNNDVDDLGKAISNLFRDNKE